MVEPYECTECEKKSDNVFVVIGKRIEGMDTFSGERGVFCSSTCLKEWAYRQERRVSSLREETKPVEYSHPNPKMNRISLEEIHEEKGELCIKPEVWERLKGD